MVSISNSLSSTAYTKSSQLSGSRTPDPSQQTRAKTTRTEDQNAAAQSQRTYTRNVQGTERVDLPENAKAASNDSGRFKDNTSLQDTHDDQTLNTEAQRGSLLDLAV